MLGWSILDISDNLSHSITFGNVCDFIPSNTVFFVLELGVVHRVVQLDQRFTDRVQVSLASREPRNHDGTAFSQIYPHC